MPLRPFPLPFSVGVDICQISRLHRIVSAEQNTNSRRDPRLHRFLRYLMTDYEEFGFWRRTLPTLQTQVTLDRPILNHLAGRYASNLKCLHRESGTKSLSSRWAAKEAVVKACSRRISFHQIIISAEQNKQPYGVVLDTVMSRRHRSHEIIRAVSTGSNPMQDGLRAGREHIATSPEDIDGQIVPLTISHDGNYATAVALYPGEAATNMVSAKEFFNNLKEPLPSQSAMSDTPVYD